MTDHRVQHERGLATKIPFGLGRWKPKHFRDMAGVVWRNRDNLPYAWQVLSRGVCDGCALGVAGFHDWTIDGVHLCMTRLNLLRLNTMPALDVDRLNDIASLEKLDNRQLRELGRLPYPMLREKDAPGFAASPGTMLMRGSRAEFAQLIRAASRSISRRAASRTKSTTSRKKRRGSSARTTSITPRASAIRPPERR
jgi:hypothetical protein